MINRKYIKETQCTVVQKLIYLWEVEPQLGSP